MHFIKMHGLGNDFIVIDCLAVNAPEEDTLSDLAQRLCHRHFGIGADGLVLLLPSSRADARMRIFNSDGSEAEMCGNATRCLARYLWERDKGLLRLRLETMAGVVEARLVIVGGELRAVEVTMGVPRLERGDIPMVGPAGRVIEEELVKEGFAVRVTAVSMGNPHAVIFHDGELDLLEVGPALEKHPAFPRHTNVELVKVKTPDHVEVAVWERGAGVTLACGTGACAVAVAGVLTGRTSRRVTVSLPGGDLEISWPRDDCPVFMTGPAEEVFQGELPARTLIKET